MLDAAGPPDPDLDLRLVRYFTVVAEHLNFRLAAEALHLAQPSLSRQIQRLERQLGARLLDRTPQGSRLTEAGEAFLPQAHALLRDARWAAFSVRTARPPQTVTVGYVEDLVVSPAVRDLRRRFPDADVRTHHLHWGSADRDLLAHRVDVLVARMPFPFDAGGLDVTVLYEEPRVLVVAAGHRLATRASVAVEDFGEDPRLPCGEAAVVTPAWSAFWRLEPRPDGRAVPVGAVVPNTYEDKLELIAGDQAIAIMPAGDRRVGLRDDLAAVPIEAVDPCLVVVATRAGEQHPLATEFLASSRAHLRPAEPARRGA